MNILDIEMQENDADAKTIRDYLKTLLRNLWSQGEGFSGKRPFGNSGWEFEIYKALVVAGAVKGEVDKEYGDLIDCNFSKANQLIFKAIEELN